MEVVKSLIKCNFETRTNRKIEYIVIHYTAGLTSKKGSALNCARGTFSNPNTKASAHYIVDDETIVQAVEDKNKSWHCGTSGKYYHSYCRNENSIGIEISSNYKGGIPAGKQYKDLYSSDANWYLTDSAVNNAAELTANLMKKYNLGIDRVLRHYDVTHKDCPSPMVDTNKNGPENWEKFKKLVLKYYNGITTNNSDNINIDASIKDKGGVQSVIYHTLEEVPEWSKTQVKWFIDNGYLQGNGKGDLNISNDFLRTLVILYRVIADKE